MNINSIGYGLGTRDPESYPNVLSLWIGDLSVPKDETGLILLETNLDDTTGETLGYVQEKLFELGARDVWFTPIQMKKNRPGVLLSSLIDESLKERIADFIMLETSTLGIRVRPVERIEADREIERFESSLGNVGIKLKKKNGLVVSVSPEYEDCKKIASDDSIPLNQVVFLVKREAEGIYLQNI